MPEVRQTNEKRKNKDSEEIQTQKKEDGFLPEWRKKAKEAEEKQSQLFEKPAASPPKE